MTNKTARALLHRHGLPEDVIDGALCLHAQELAALQRLRMEELDLTGQKARIVGRIVDLIDPARTPAAVSAVVEPPADQTTPSHRAALREQLAGALIAWTYRGKEPDPETGILETVRANAYSRADAVLAVLYREWPWLRAEAEDAAPPADRATVLHEAADVAERVAIKRHEQHEIEREQGAYDVMTVLRRVADETAATATQARRGDQFEAWLKQQRDSFGWQGANDRRLFDTLDGILDRYRLHADTGTPLGEHLCEGRVVGDCECLEQPAAGARQDGAQP